MHQVFYYKIQVSLATVITKCVRASVKDVKLCIALYIANYKDIDFVINVIQSIS